MSHFPDYAILSDQCLSLVAVCPACGDEHGNGDELLCEECMATAEDETAFCDVVPPSIGKVSTPDPCNPLGDVNEQQVCFC
jgi:hypothetical protein